MGNVYYKPITNYEDKDLINKTTYDMLKEMIKEEGIEFEGTTPLKVHFGERGNDTFITPDNFDGIKKYLKDNNINTCYIETNVLYKGSRTLTADHIETAKEHGFTDLDIVIADGDTDSAYEDHIETAKEHGFTDLDIVIADGDTDSAYEDIEINKEFFQKCKIGYKFKDYKNFIVLAHFKGHGLAGFGGSVKQLGMGFASRGGKLNQHSNAIPIISNKCISCGMCAEKCPVNAITITKKAVISKDACIGCASCSGVCPVNAISNNWKTSNFLEKLAEYAYAATKDKTNIYFNFVFNITDDCDCCGRHMKIVAPNIGIFASTDPVAIDTATIDKVQEVTNSKLFDMARTSLKHAEKIGLGTCKYRVIEIGK